MAKQKYMMTADDIAEELNCSKSYAYLRRSPEQCRKTSQ